MISFRGYEIIEVLPKGGMSTVYKARQLSLDRLVAIKVLPPAKGLDPADVEKFMDEARITASLKHPNIIQVYDFGKTEEGIYYFVMEYISGYTVASWIRRKKYLSEENSLLCGLSVATAMNYAWQKAGIVHCDIKPDNVIIDGDGTVKIADLGLARSVKTIVGRSGPEERLIFGTPNYISPEQSRGDEPLDCRADIYSLGAMLYHCMTGAMPFEGLPSLEIMDRQIDDQIKDPQDINPQISVWSACLIEKMMAKQPKHRQQDWNETIKDISNVRSEMMPQVVLSSESVSTIKRSAMRNTRWQSVYLAPEGEVEEKARAYPPAGEQTIIARGGLGLFRNAKFVVPVVLLAFISGWLIYDFLKSNESVKIENEKAAGLRHLAPTQPTAVKTDAEAEASEKYEQVAMWARANPFKNEEVISRYRLVAEETRGTKYADLARDEIQKLEQVLKGTKSLMEQLDKKADALAGQNRLMVAAEVYEKYRGPYENETAAEREKKAQSFRQKQAVFSKEQQRQHKSRFERDKLAGLQLKHIVWEIAWIMVADDLRAALSRMDEVAGDVPSLASGKEFKNMKSVLEKAGQAEQNILNSFRSQKNQNVTVSFATGPTNLFIRDVQEGTVIAEKVIVTERGTIGIQKNFRVRDLSLDEKIARLGQEEGEEFAVMRTVLALESGDCQSAFTCAAKTGPLLSEPLAEAVKKESERRANLVMAFIVRRAGINDKDPAPDSCLRSLRGKTFSSRKSAELLRSVSQFRARFGFTDTAHRYDVVLQALTNADLRQNETVMPQGKEVKPPEQPQPANEAIGSVAKRLLDLNVGLRENEIVFQPDSSGQAEAVEIVSVCLRDIKPIENLTTLQKLVCAGMRQHIWADTPLIAPLDDLSPLKEINLTELMVNHTRVKDISPLGHMPLVSLSLAYTRVNDLQPLKGKQLQNLDISFTSVRDIKLLAGMPLVCLDISGTDISDISPLRGAPLTGLYAGFTRVRDLSALSSMRLTRLSIRNTPVNDISCLQQMPLEFLNISGTRVRDIAALNGLPLQRLEISDCDIGDLSALKGMSLNYLDLRNTKVRDISALDGLPLEFLNISRTGIKDISALKNMPLKTLFLRETDLPDLTPIEDSGIEEIWIGDFHDRINSEKNRSILAVLYKMPKLRSVNGHPFGMQPKAE